MKTQIEHSAAVQLAELAMERIPELVGTYCCDLHNEIFNSDYWIIGRYQAEQWLIKCGGVFFCIGLVSDYEKDNFGEINTDLSEAEHISNMVAYIEGETVLSMSETLRENWDEELTEEMAEKIVSELKEEFGI